MPKRRPPPPVVIQPEITSLIDQAREGMFQGARIQIPWALVDDMLSAGLSGFEIAGLLGIHEDTLYNACRIDHAQEFRQYKARKKARGDGLLKLAQFRSALDGSDIQLIWLGKQRLGQREKPEEQKTGDGAGGFAILEIADNGRSVKDHNPANQPPGSEDPEEAVDTSELE